MRRRLGLALAVVTAGLAVGGCEDEAAMRECFNRNVLGCFFLFAGAQPAGHTSEQPAQASATAFGFKARFNGVLTDRGRASRAGDVVRVRGVRASGSFTVDRLRRTRARSSRLRFSNRGNWLSTQNLAIRPNDKRATGSGYVLATFTSGGEVCLRFKTRYRLSRAGRLVESGSLRTLGGSGQGARLVATGSYKQGAATGGWAMSGDGTADQGRRRSLPRACRALK